MREVCNTCGLPFPCGSGHIGGPRIEEEPVEEKNAVPGEMLPELPDSAYGPDAVPLDPPAETRGGRSRKDYVVAPPPDGDCDDLACDCGGDQ